MGVTETGVKMFNPSVDMPGMCLLQPPPVPEATHCIQGFKFSAEVLINCWSLLTELKSNSSSLETVVKKTLRLALPVAEYTNVVAQIDSGEILLPRRTCMQAIGSKLFVIDLLYERKMITTHSASRHWTPDASLQGTQICSGL